MKMSPHDALIYGLFLMFHDHSDSDNVIVLAVVAIVIVNRNQF